MSVTNTTEKMLASIRMLIRPDCFIELLFNLNGAPSRALILWKACLVALKDLRRLIEVNFPNLSTPYYNPYHGHGSARFSA
jgi:hypothetical protein